MKTYRICERWEVYVEAESEEEALNKYHCGDGTGHPEFVEFLSIEEEVTYEGAFPTLDNQTATR